MKHMKYFFMSFPIVWVIEENYVVIPEAGKRYDILQLLIKESKRYTHGFQLKEKKT